MEKYLVGGAVRDKLLGIADDATENDWLIVGATPKEMKKLGYLQVGKEFPVFLDPENKEEYALARKERKVGKGYKGFEFDTSTSVTLEQDLSRRDLTINAMAMKDGILFDPFHGQEDLNNGLLKHVSDAFSEDPVRVLRVARFAARFKLFGFKVAHSTHRLMSSMVESGEVDALTPERVFKELDKALSYPTPSAFFKVLSACGAYSRIFSELDKTKQNKHGNDFEFLDNLGTDDKQIKFALWLSDQNNQNISALCSAIKCPKAYKELALLVNQWQGFVTDFINQSAEDILEFFNRTDALRRANRFEKILQAFALLGHDTTQISSLLKQLLDIKLDYDNSKDIAQALRVEKIKKIELFLNSAK